MSIGDVRCVVFDLDDTLWNTSACLEIAHGAMCSVLDERCPEVGAKYRDVPSFAAEMKSTMSAHVERKHDFTWLRSTTLERLTADGGHAAAATAAFVQARNQPSLFPGALEALRALKALGLQIGTLTDGNADPMIIDGLKDVVDFCVNAVDAGASKPDRRMFALCESKSGCDPSSLVMVGDNAEKDVAGAKAAGWRAIWVRPPMDGAAFGGAHSLHAAGSAAAVEAAGSLAEATVRHVDEVEAALRSWAAP